MNPPRKQSNIATSAVVENTLKQLWRQRRLASTVVEKTVKHLSFSNTFFVFFSFYMGLKIKYNCQTEKDYPQAH